MTISTTDNRVSFAGNDSTDAFATGFKFFADGDLTVTLVTDSTGAEVVQVITTNYTVTGAGVDSGGTVTMVTAPASGETLVIERTQAYTQGLDLVENDPFPSDSVEDQLDKLAIMTQQNNSLVGRTLRQPDGDTADIDRLPVKVTRATKVLAFDSDGDPVASTTTLADLESGATDAAASASAAATSATASANSATASAASASAASTSETNAAASAASAAASVGAVNVSSNDTTPGNLEAKLLVGDGLSLSTQNDGGNETRTVAVPDAGVAVAKIANGIDGELITWDALGVATTVGAGTADQVLTSNGAGAAPTFQDASGGGFIQTQYFTSSGTYTPHADTSKLKVTVIGGGGGGGGVGTSTGYNVSAAGGPGGGAAIEEFAIGDITSTVAVTIGAAGTAGAATGGTGGTGGTSSFGAYCSATGGGGGVGKAGDSYSVVSPGTPGSGFGGDINITGGYGGYSQVIEGRVDNVGGDGGDSLMGFGGHGAVHENSTLSVAGNAGTGYGAAGSGAVCYNTGSALGGVGTAGIVIIEEYA